MSAFVGRQAELEVLEMQYASPRAEMAIVYGRRRVGKTALITHFCKGKRALYFSANRWTDSLQLRAFSRAVSDFAGLRRPIDFDDWTDALEYLSDLYPDERLILAIDEFQYIAQERSSILSELQNLWDHNLQQKNLLIILCGSAVSFIAKEVLGQQNPLYGRARTIMKVAPLPFVDAAKIVPQFNAEDQFKLYAVLGGMPFYYESIRPNLTFEENIAFNAILNASFLNQEPQSVIMGEFRDPSTYNAILNAISFGATTFNEIAQKSALPASRLPFYLGVLQDMDLVEKEFPVLFNLSDRGNIQRGIYRLSDNFLRFWFRFIATQTVPVMTRREALDVWSENIESAFSEFAAQAFEDVCKQYLWRKRFEDQLPMKPVRLGRWWHKSVEIDLVGPDAKGDNVLVAECKYRHQKTGISVLRALDKKCESLPIKKSVKVHRYLFSRSGFDDALTALSHTDPTLHLIKLEDLLV